MLRGGAVSVLSRGETRIQDLAFHVAVSLLA